MKEALATLLILFSTTAVAAEISPGAKIAFFGVHFIDTSTEGAVNGVRADEVERIALVERYVAEQFTERQLELVDITPVQSDLDRIVNPADCNYCDVLMARKLDADFTLVGEVQKVSNLILSMNLVMRETAEGQFVKGMSVDVRSNTDESWLRGMRYILKNNIFRGE
ncbi:MAG: DUF3280 domain-containing protein [Pseudomonadota bacterium]